MHEKEVSIVQDYIYECLFEPNIGWPKLEFARRTYARWAANEILKRISDDTLGRNVKDIIEEFRIETDRYSEVNYDRTKAFIFDVARETAEEIGSLFV